MKESQVMNWKRKIALGLTNTILSGTRNWSFPIKRRLLNWGGIFVENGTKVVGPIYITGNLRIGKNTWIGHDFSVDGDGCVIIGDNCDIAPRVHCYTGGHLIGGYNRRAGEGYNKNIVINNGCWICAETKILAGVEISDGVVVAAGAVVTNSIKANLLVGGVPAKEVRRLNDESKSDFGK